jgi:hypothetical protein
MKAFILLLPFLLVSCSSFHGNRDVAQVASGGEVGNPLFLRKKDLKHELEVIQKKNQDYEKRIKELESKIKELEDPEVTIKTTFLITEIKPSAYAEFGSSEFDATLLTNKNWEFGLYCSSYRPVEDVTEERHLRHNLGLTDRAKRKDGRVHYIYAEISFKACQQILAAEHTVSKEKPLKITVVHFGDEEKQKVVEISH